MHYLTDKNFLQSILGDGTEKVMVLFTAPWCGFCPAMKSTLESIQSEVLPLDITIYGCDVELCPESADAMQLMSLPTCIMFDKGVEVKRLVGSHPRASLWTWMFE